MALCPNAESSKSVALVTIAPVQIYREDEAPLPLSNS